MARPVVFLTGCSSGQPANAAAALHAMQLPHMLHAGMGMHQMQLRTQSQLHSQGPAHNAAGTQHP